jgi:hypothetical protein
MCGIPILWLDVLTGRDLMHSGRDSRAMFEARKRRATGCSDDWEFIGTAYDRRRPSRSSKRSSKGAGDGHRRRSSEATTASTVSSGYSSDDGSYVTTRTHSSTKPLIDTSGRPSSGGDSFGGSTTKTHLDKPVAAADPPRGKATYAVENAALDHVRYAEKEKGQGRKDHDAVPPVGTFQNSHQLRRRA